MRLTQFLGGDGTIFRDASIWPLKPLRGKAPSTTSSHSLGNQLEWKRDFFQLCPKNFKSLPTRWEINLNGNNKKVRGTGILLVHFFTLSCKRDYFLLISLIMEKLCAYKLHTRQLLEKNQGKHRVSLSSVERFGRALAYSSSVQNFGHENRKAPCRCDR